ncbi:MAG: ATP-binding protein [Phycisphaerales bacterium]|nr:MAG: ATP-binding protein [Phycisphaerales bacterium]
MAEDSQDREPDVRLEMFSQPKLLSGARAMISNIAQRLGFNEIECGQISLAVDEALCNIINHGYSKREDGRIWLSVWALSTCPPHIRVVIEDLAQQVDVSEIEPRDLDVIRPGGLGVHLMRQIMDEVCYEKRPAGGMRLTMSKMRRDPPGNADSGAEPTPPADKSEPEHE